MNKEIKEILAYFEEYIKITDMHDSEPMLNWKDLKIVLDYITNLEQENEKLKFYLKVKFNEYDSLEKATKLIEDYKDVLESGYEEYKSRIDKTIEYIRENFQQNTISGSEYLITYSCCTDLLNILEGEDK